MQTRSIFLAAASLVALTTVALAFELVMKADPENVVATRITGTWKLEPTLTKRFDPDNSAKAPSTMTFTDNPGVLAGLQADSARFKNRTIFASGIVNVDGTTHTYILSNRSGNMYVTWYTAVEENATSNPVEKTVNIAVARDQARDILVLGGPGVRDASAAYERVTR